MMDVFEVIKKRRSIREFSDQPLTRETLLQIMDAGRYAATARNEQPWEFVAIEESKILQELARIAPNGKFLASAKACTAIFCKDTKYYLEDGCAATQNILLAATALGVGSCWIAGEKKPYASQISALLNVPANYKLVSLIALGYPKDPGQLRVTEKRELQAMTHWEKF